MPKHGGLQLSQSSCRLIEYFVDVVKGAVTLQVDDDTLRNELRYDEEY